MRNYKNIILIMITTILLYGCTSEHLDVQPKDRYTEDNFWTSEDNAMSALSGAYAVLMRSGMFDGGEGTALLEETATPNAYNYINRMGYGVIGQGTQTSTNASIFNARWFNSYRGIGRCNTILDKIDQVEIEEGLKNRMKAEAKFLRAFYYSMLTTYFGDVPLILDPPNVETQSKLSKTPRVEVVEQILTDLEDAALVLPLKYTGSNIGRATKGAALALKARLLLFEASPLNNSGDVNNPVGDVQKWKAAADAAKAVLDLAGQAGYGLFPNYRSLFLQENENSEECIFDVQFFAPEQGSSFDVVSRQWNDNAPLRDLIDAYEMQAGYTYNPEKPYENRDPRMYQTLVFPGDTYRGSITSHTSPFKNTGYGVKKYTIYDKEANLLMVNEGRSDINYMIIRYADVLLMYAEAQNEVSAAPQDDPLIYKNVNLVRQRAGMPDVPVGKNKEEMREIIRHERRIEFACEGTYYNDIRRWRTAEIVMNATIYNSQNQPIVKRTFDPSTNYWWLIPQVQLDLNPNLK